MYPCLATSTPGIRSALLIKKSGVGCKDGTRTSQNLRLVGTRLSHSMSGIIHRLAPFPPWAGPAKEEVPDAIDAWPGCTLCGLFANRNTRLLHKCRQAVMSLERAASQDRTCNLQFPELSETSSKDPSGGIEAES